MTLTEALARVAELEADMDLLEEFLTSHLLEADARQRCFFCQAEPLPFVHSHERTEGRLVCRCEPCAVPSREAWALALSRKLLDGSLAEWAGGNPQ